MGLDERFGWCRIIRSDQRSPGLPSAVGRLAIASGLNRNSPAVPWPTASKLL